MKWLAPWYSIGDGTGQIQALQRELHRELSVGHPLYAMPTRPIARRRDCDDVLFLIEDGSGRVAVVHLTWTHGPETPPWPDAVLWSSLDEWIATEMGGDHEESGAEDD